MFKSFLRVFIILHSRFLPPLHCLGCVLGYTLTFVIHRAEAVLRKITSLFGGFLIPLRRLGMIFGYAVSVVIPPGETHLIF